MSSNVCNGHFVYVEKDGVIDKTNVRCNYCLGTFKYHHSLSSLKYQVMAYLVHILFVYHCLFTYQYALGPR